MISLIQAILTYYNLYMWLHRKKGDVEPASQVSLQYRQIPSWSLLSRSDGETSHQNGGIIIIGDLVTYPNSILSHTLFLSYQYRFDI